MGRRKEQEYRADNNSAMIKRIEADEEFKAAVVALTEGRSDFTDTITDILAGLAEKYDASPEIMAAAIKSLLSQDERVE